MEDKIFNITASEIEERYKTMKPLPPHPMELMAIARIMEEVAKLPKEELGKRQPGERCMYEL